MVEKLSIKSGDELLELFTNVFSMTPFLPGSIEDRDKTREFFKSTLELYKDAEDTVAYGIRQEGKLACAAMIAPASSHFSFFSTAGFLGAILFETGLKTIQALSVMQSQKPKNTEGLVELVILATDPQFQGRGLAKSIFEVLYNEAKEKKYTGVLLLVQKETPAHKIYIRQGFVESSTFDFTGTTLSWMIRNI